MDKLHYQVIDNGDGTYTHTFNDDRLNEYLEKIGASITEGLVSFQDYFQEYIAPILFRLGESMKELFDAMYQVYLNDGAIYGENHDGMMRWYRERSKIEQFRNEATRIEQEHEFLRLFKQKLKN